MKGINLSLLSGVVLSLSNCTPHQISSYEPEEANASTPKVETQNPYLITKKDALKSLVQMARQLYDHNDLRSGQSSFLDQLSRLTEEDLEVVDNSCTLRATTTGRTDEMFYLVNFDEAKGGGYAVLSADDRIPDPVICIVETGSINKEDFISPSQLFTEDSIRHYVPDFKLYDSVTDDYYVALSEDAMRSKHIAHLITNYYDQSTCNIEGEDYGIASNPSPSTTEYGEWVVKEGKNALLNTKWHQSSPFNDLAPEKSKYWFFGPKGKAPTGCVPIAIAQIVTLNQNPKNYTINGVKMDWELMNSFHKNDNDSRTLATAEVKNMVSTLARHIGSKCDSQYTYNWTFTFPKKPVKYLEELGYKDVKYRLGKVTDTCIDMIKEGKPVFISAISGVFGGHGWVLDGYRTYEREVREKQGSTIISSKKETRTMVHSNFGWGGKADGYYAAGTFNTKKGPEELDQERDLKDTSTGTSHFGWFFSVITYNLN